MFKRTLIMLLVFLMASSLAFALDDQGNPNDPTVNDRANACYEGGTMEDRCVTELDWQAGWYLIRYEYGLLSREDIPSWVAWVLPEEPEPEPETSVSSCVDDGSDSWWYVGSSNYLTAGTFAYADASCSGEYIGIAGSSVAYAPGGLAAATTICRAHGHIGVPSRFGPYTPPSDFYICN